MSDQMPPTNEGPPNPQGVPPQGAPPPSFGQPADSGWGQPAAPPGAPPAPYGQPAPGAPPAPYGQPGSTGFLPPSGPGYGAAPPGGFGAAPPQYGGGFGAQPALVDSQGRPVAEWWQRLVAYLIDGVIAGIPAWIPYFLIVAISTTTTTYAYGFQVSTTSTLGILFGYFLVWVVYWVYFAVLDGSAKGQTVGKMIMGIATRDVATGGSIGMGRSFLRWLIMIVPILGLISGLMPLWDPERRGIHDKLAGSTVVVVR